MAEQRAPLAALGGLGRLARERPPDERCDLCSAPLGARHRHLLEAETGRVACSCDPCAILFSGQDGARYRAIPDEVRLLPDFDLPDEMWDRLAIPVGMAFFQRRPPARHVVAFYPSPAGPTESLLALDAWSELEAANPVLRRLRPGVEALLVNRVGRARDHFVVPIDRCYGLVGLIRLGWRGLSGGTEVWKEIAGFFDELKAGARTASARDA